MGCCGPICEGDGTLHWEAEKQGMRWQLSDGVVGQLEGPWAAGSFLGCTSPAQLPENSPDVLLGFVLRTAFVAPSCGKTEAAAGR